MRVEMSSIILWYLFLLALGGGSLPLAMRLFRAFPDRGAALAKPLGLLCLSYLVWLTGSLRIAPFQPRAIVAALVMLGILNLAILFRHFAEFRAAAKPMLRLFLISELLFAGVFALGVAVRMYNPDLTGAEKEADFTFLNAILRSDYFPPRDVWFSGAPVNYYYFGYMIWASVIKATGVIAPVGFNLALAAILGMAAAGSFGLVYHWTRRVSLGLFSAFLLALAANMDGLLQLIQRGGAVFPFDWWRSSRMIPDTINEFPYFSFLLGDLHAHFMAIPFLLLLIGLLAQMAEGGKRFNWPAFLMSGAALGSAAFINTWDYPPALIFAAGSLFAACRDFQADAARSQWRRVAVFAGSVIGVMLVSRLAFWPFYQHFAPQLTFKNLRVVAAEQRTGIQYFLTIYALFLWGILPILLERLWRLAPIHRRRTRETLLISVNAALFAAAVLAVSVSGRVLLISGAAAIIFFALWRRETDALRKTPLLLVALAFAIVAGCELFYIQDFYGHPLERQNTIFKFTYHAWVLLALGVPALMGRSWQTLRAKAARIGWAAGVALLAASCSIYPIFATIEKTNRFRSGDAGGLFYLPTLNGSSYVAYNHPQEYDALVWIEAHLDRNAVMLEATGNPYSYFGRVATNTGRATVLGWGNHEALWRDPTWKSIMERTEDIRQMYDAPDKSAVAALFQKYRVNYVFVGELERQTYRIDGLNAFAAAFPAVYENLVVTIYQIAEGKPVAPRYGAGNEVSFE